MKNRVQIVSICCVLFIASCSVLNPGSAGSATQVNPKVTATFLQNLSETETAVIVIPTETPLPTATIVVPSSASLVTEKIENTSDSPGFTIMLESVRMEGDAYFAEPFNALVKALLEAEQFLFQEGLDEIEAWRLANMPDIRSTLDSTYSVAYNENLLISIHFEFYSYVAGAAHPLSYSKTLTYDMLSRQEIQLEDLFLAGSDWLTTISTYSINDLNTKGMLLFPEGAQPVIDNFTRWVITPEGLEFFFDPYQVAPYAAGPQQVLIPYSELGEVIADPGVLTPLLP